MSTKSTTAPGPSGLSNDYLKALVHDDIWMRALKALYEQLLNNPVTTIGKFPLLYQFQASFLTKPNGKLRPISMQESITNVLHKMLLRMIRKPTSKYQLAMEKYALTKCVIEAKVLG